MPSKPREGRVLGTTQKSVLHALRGHHRWFEGCGWNWTTHRETERILDTLVIRGLVSKKVEDIRWTKRMVYRPVELKPNN